MNLEKTMLPLVKLNHNYNNTNLNERKLEGYASYRNLKRF